MIGNDNEVLIFLAFRLLPGTMSCLCLEFLSCFNIVFILFFFVRCMKYYQYCNHVKIILVPTVHQPCVCTHYVQESKKLRVLIINKDERKLLVRKNENENLIWSWNDSGGGRAGGRIRDDRGATRSEAGGGKEEDGGDKDRSGTGKQETERNGGSHVSSNRAEGKYCAEGTDWEESADESAEWRGKEKEELATEEESETAGGTGGGVRKTLTATVRVLK